MAKFLHLTEPLMAYVESLGPREVDAQRLCRTETAAMGPVSGMQIGADQGAFMQLLVKLTAAKRCLEIGVFTGYSALSVALALPADGTIDACDVSKDFTDRARRYWEIGGVADKIRLHLAPAAQTLEGFLKEGLAGTYDFAFIDADKGSYAAYYALVLELLRPGGVIAIDNALWSGRVADAGAQDVDTVAIRDLNAAIAKDERVDAAMLTIGDGILLARKKG